jgi:hypothetical protein
VQHLAEQAVVYLGDIEVEVVLGSTIDSKRLAAVVDHEVVMPVEHAVLSLRVFEESFGEFREAAQTIQEHNYDFDRRQELELWMWLVFPDVLLIVLIPMGSKSGMAL